MSTRPFASPFSWNGYYGDIIADVWNDLGSLAIPTSNYLALRVAEYAFIADGTYRSAVDRILSYFITDLDIRGEALTDEQKDRWRSYLIEKVDYHNLLHQLGLDLACYGNSFFSVLPEFKRFLICPRCSLTVSFREAYENKAWNFRWTQFEFHIRCPRCGYNGEAQRLDQNVAEQGNVLFKRWNPHEMELIWDPYTEKVHYVWRIPEEYRRLVREGKLFVLENAPWEVLQAVKNNNYILFDQGLVYHMKEETLAGIRNRGWGISKVLLNFRQVWQAQVLRRYNEALCLDYIIPFRLITPATPAPGSASDPLNQNLSQVASLVHDMLRRRRRDPATWFFLPFPVQYQALGGDATRLAPHEYIQQVVDMELNNIGVPAEMYRGTLTLQTAPAAMRLFESIHSLIPHNLNGLLRYLTQRLAALLHWERPDIRLQRVTYADDLTRQQAKLQLLMGGAISQSTGLQSVGLDFREEAQRMADDSRRVAEINAKMQEQMQQASIMAQLTSPPAPTAPNAGQPGASPDQANANAAAAPTAQPSAPAAGQQGQQGQPAGGQPAGTQPAGGQPSSTQLAQAWRPIGPNERITVEELQERAYAIASQLAQMDHAQRVTQLHRLKQMSPTLWALVTGLMKDWRQQARSQGGPQVMGQTFGEP
jgi:hypothetical protein